MRLDPSKLESVQQLGIEKRFCADIIRNVRSHFHSVLADLARYHLLEIPPLPSLQRLTLYQIVDEIEPLGGKLPKMILPELLPDPIIPTLLISHIIIDQLPAAPNLFLIDFQSENNLTRGKPSSLMTSKILIRSFDPPLGGPILPSTRIDNTFQSELDSYIISPIWMEQGRAQAAAQLRGEEYEGDI